MSLATYIDMLVGAEPAGGLVELRHKKTNGMGQAWFPCEKRRDIIDAVHRLGRTSDL